MSSAAMPGSFASPIGRANSQHAVRRRAWAHAEVDEVVPVERRAAGTSSARRPRGRCASASPLASKCGTLYLPISVGMRLVAAAPAGACPPASTRSTCCTPAAFAACARLRACASSFSGEKCSQKLVTQNAPCAPANARSRLAAIVEVGRDDLGAARGERAAPCPSRTSRVIARTAKPPSGRRGSRAPGRRPARRWRRRRR